MQGNYSSLEYWVTHVSERPALQTCVSPSAYLGINVNFGFRTAKPLSLSVGSLKWSVCERKEFQARSWARVEIQFSLTPSTPNTPTFPPPAHTHTPHHHHLYVVHWVLFKKELYSSVCSWVRPTCPDYYNAVFVENLWSGFDISSK